jgi:hypothetical protein
MQIGPEFNLGPRQIANVKGFFFEVVVKIPDY